ncbi:hypothetical protein TNIN_282361 [Trichonephila inaurata madagascariensis]|uniref:Uncharacterized protein n=1 Tax=Trichonephila inaurata madagascariensis TaxID=2747483 RepID=A0A8X7CML6_9ARAC|nr:hypothetical protein TNIN_282361 [Trichonephila inaurata madagascariensis]
MSTQSLADRQIPLDCEATQMMEEWSARPPDLDPIDYDCDAVCRTIVVLQLPPRTLLGSLASVAQTRSLRGPPIVPSNEQFMYARELKSSIKPVTHSN